MRSKYIQVPLGTQGLALVSTCQNPSLATLACAPCPLPDTMWFSYKESHPTLSLSKFLDCLSHLLLGILPRAVYKYLLECLLSVLGGTQWVMDLLTQILIPFFKKKSHIKKTPAAVPFSRWAGHAQRFCFPYTLANTCCFLVGFVWGSERCVCFT